MTDFIYGLFVGGVPGFVLFVWACRMWMVDNRDWQNEYSRVYWDLEHLRERIDDARADALQERGDTDRGQRDGDGNRYQRRQGATWHRRTSDSAGASDGSIRGDSAGQAD